jgi:hypothetical protein
MSQHKTNLRGIGQTVKVNAETVGEIHHRVHPGVTGGKTFFESWPGPAMSHHEGIIQRRAFAPPT